MSSWTRKSQRVTPRRRPGRIGMTQHRFGIHLDGIIEVLARNLYADPDVFVREMIQNAHDAILKRRATQASRLRGRIDVAIDAERNAITFSDNGSGLTRTELHEYLSTIGASDKAALRAVLAGEGTSPVGRFGIGLLSGFIVAESIEVTTRSSDGEPLRWI